MLFVFVVRKQLEKVLLGDFQTFKDLLLLDGLVRNVLEWFPI